MKLSSGFTTRWRLAALALLGILGAGAPRLLAALPPDQVEFFEKRIRPVLVAECYECHNAEKTRGGLRLDYREGWQKGGDTGEAIVPGDPAKGLFMESIRHIDPDLKMPDKAPKLEESVIADFATWIAMGAPDPRDEPPSPQAAKPTWANLLELRRTWWSLQPVQKPAVPDVKDAAWSEHPVDRFLLAKLEAKGLAPAAPADARTFIRRLTFTLTGLPPTPGEVEAFVAESIGNWPSAIGNLVARLLASPRFGEHWARHWMDLMRYAETHGSEGDPEIPQAWRYRDYLIRAFNGGVPEDQLIREHLAGDLLAQPRMNPAGFSESILGTAQFRFVEHGFQPIDTLDDQVKAVDNQIDVVTKAFQATTVSCARCHDHKFDAVSQRDFTALYGIFASCRPAQVTIDAPGVREKNRAELETLHGKIKAGLAEAWLASAAEMGTRLQQESARAAKVQEAAAQIRGLEKQLADFDWNARHERTTGGPPVTAELTGEPPVVPPPAPFAAWTFQHDASDTLGRLDGQLEGGAEIRHGRLVLDGQTAYLRTGVLPVTIREKTLEAWVTLAILDQKAGGVISIEGTKVHGFDSIVFAEREPRRWMAGSDHAKRSESVEAGPEAAPPGTLLHLAIVYGADSRITIYRNGQPLGRSYGKGELKTYEAGAARVLLGLRHGGAKNGFFAGEVEEARLYDRPLSAAEVAASFHNGPSTSEAVPLTEAQRAERAALVQQLHTLRAASQDSQAQAWDETLRDATTNETNPFHLWAKLNGAAGAAFPDAWKALAQKLTAQREEARAFNRENFRPLWDLAGDDYATWFPHGSGLTARPVGPGEFSIEPKGDRVLDQILPAGIVTNRLSDKHNGLLTSPDFRIDSANLYVHAAGGGGSSIRVIIDHYPLPSNPIYPKALLDKEAPGWVRVDTAYRKGSTAYLEFGTRDDVTRPLVEKKSESAKSGRYGDGRSFFAVSRILASDGRELPREENAALLPLLAGPAPQSAADLAARYSGVLGEAIAAWRDGGLTEPQRALLDFLVRRSLLPVSLPELAKIRPLVAEYRRLEAEVPMLQRAPGVIESLAKDAPLFERGDHTKPGPPVPRGYLGVLGGPSYRTPLSGRLELADELATARNPLTARVMVNRIWHWLFGRGLVPMVDDFGRLGEKPTHPELLDYLAAEFVERGWSTREMIRFLVTTRTFAMSSTPSPRATEIDPANEWLSHFRVRRLPAESVRDTLLAVSGRLDETMYGKAIDAEIPRRSVYTEVKRTKLDPFLQVFDAPKPFTTLGRRDLTNVPAQSLTMLNSPFVIEQAGKWAERLTRDDSPTTDARVSRMFATALSRPPADRELAAAKNYLAALAADRQLPPDAMLASASLWQDFAQSLFNLKEFIYVR